MYELNRRHGKKYIGGLLRTSKNIRIDDQKIDLVKRIQKISINLQMENEPC